MQLVLASGSPYRKQLLERLNVAFVVHRPQVDEDQLKHQYTHLSPVALCQKLALLKAQSIDRSAGEVIIGSDQLVSFAQQSLGKPGDRTGAIAQLERLQGQTHELVTCTAICRGDTVIQDCNITQLQMRHLSHDQIVRYVDRDQPFDCAGAYRYETSGISLFAQVELTDETAIQGLPLIFVTRALSQLGFVIP
jgi:septum formation protein